MNEDLTLIMVWLLAPVWNLCNWNLAAGVPVPQLAVCGEIRGFPGPIRRGTRRFARVSGGIVQFA